MVFFRLHKLSLKGGGIMEKSQNKSNETLKNEGNISVRNSTKTEKENTPAEPLPESTRPRKDGPGGE